MSEETEVPIVCDDCGGNLTNAVLTMDDLFSMALGEDRPHYWHMEQSGCIASLNERLTAATERAEFWNNAHRADLMEADVKHRELRERAEAAEAERDVSATAHRIACGALAESWERRRELRAEREALRKDAARLDWMESQKVLRASFYPLCFPPCWVVEASEVTSGETLRVAIDAAMLAQPTTGEGA